MKLILALLFTVNAYATFTPFPPSPVAPDSLVTKGGLLTSDGRDQVEALACANDQIIVFDSAEVNGFKCEAKPVAFSGPITTFSSSFATSSGSAEFVFSDVVSVASFVVGPSGEIEADVVPSASGLLLITDNGAACARRLVVDGTVVWLWDQGNSATKEYSSLPMYGTYPAGTYTVSLQTKQQSTGSCSISGRLKLKTW